MTRYGPVLSLNVATEPIGTIAPLFERVLSWAMSARVVAVLGVGLGGHAIGAAEQVEVVDVGRAEIDLQRLEHALRRHAEHVGLGPVDVGQDARGRGVEEA